MDISASTQALYDVYSTMLNKVRLMIKKTNVLALCLSFLLSACGSSIDQEVLIKKYSNAYSRFMTLDGNRIHYRDEGQGDVIVLIPGTASSVVVELTGHFNNGI